MATELTESAQAQPTSRPVEREPIPGAPAPAAATEAGALARVARPAEVAGAGQLAEAPSLDFSPLAGAASTGLRAAFLVAVCLVAYHYSLSTLLVGLSLTTPLAYLGLVPLIAVLLAVARALQAPDELDIHDRYLDWIVGLPLLATGLILVAVVPAYLSTYFWLWRLDLLSLPFFVAGAIDLVFGARALWRLRIAVVFLGLASPAPYLLFVNSQLHVLTDATLAVLRQLTALLSLAQPLQIGNGSLFAITHTGREFILNVDAASTGVDSVLGFLLVGAAIAAVVVGPLVGRLGWLVAGALLIWLLDLARVLALFAAGRAWGEQFVLQPFAGLVALVLGALLMMVVLPWFRLRVEIMRSAAPLRTGGRAASGQASALRRLLPALAVLLAAGVLAGIADDGLSRFRLIATPLGQPLLQPSAAVDHPVPGWKVRRTQSYAWIGAYLGAGATWERYQYAPPVDQPPAPAAQGPSPVTLDLFTTADRGKLDSYGIQEAYHLNRYRLADGRRTDLGGGVAGYSVLYRSRIGGQSWTAVYWDWPVRTSQGVAYERVVLTYGKGPVAGAPSTPLLAEPVGGLTPGLATAVGSAEGRMQRPADTDARDFLVRLGRRVIVAAGGAQA